MGASWHKFVLLKTNQISPIMKYLFSTLAMLSLILSQSCVEDTEPGQQKLGVAFSLSSDNQMISDLPANSKLVVNVQSQTGESIMEFAEVQFQLSDDGFVTRPIDLPFGNYAITDFMIVNENDEIIYAVPKSSGTLADKVTQPLNLEFSYSSSVASEITNLRLLDVRNHKAEEFGYASFKKPGQGLNIMVNEKGSSKPTTGKASIMNGNMTLAIFNLAAKMNHITLPPGLTGDHKLVISKDGFAGGTFTLAELLEKKNKTLKVELEPALTILAYVGFESVSMFNFDLAGPQGTSVIIDWGDGTTEVHEMNPERSFPVHTYAADGNYPITITGDIDKITFFYSFYGQGMMDDVNFQHLTDLEEIRFGLSRSPAVLDLSHNTKLKFALLAGLDNLEKLYLPESHHLLDLSLAGPNLLSTEAVDAVIDNMHRNVVNNDLRNGTIGLQATWWEEDQSMIGPPSPQAMAKLQIMKNDYGWGVYPETLD